MESNKQLQTDKTCIACGIIQRWNNKSREFCLGEIHLRMLFHEPVRNDTALNMEVGDKGMYPPLKKGLSCYYAPGM